jgi:hypothetical protein
VVTTNLGNTINIAIDGNTGDVVTIGNTNVGTQVELDAHFLDLNDNANAATIIDIGGVNNNGGNTISIATEATTPDSIYIGNTNASTTTTLSGGTLSLINFPNFDVAATTNGLQHTTSRRNNTFYN